ncbi:MAG: hypothetical protein ABEH78_00605 [Haloferacaceae archaeon]
MTDCATTAAFDAYGVSDGSVFVRRIHRALAATDAEGPYTTGTFDRLERAFRAAFADETGLNDLPEPVALALADALYWTRERYLGATADLRTDVVTDFYRELAGYHCAYARPRSAPDYE